MKSADEKTDVALFFLIIYIVSFALEFNDNQTKLDVFLSFFLINENELISTTKIKIEINYVVVCISHLFLFRKRPILRNV